MAQDYQRQPRSPHGSDNDQLVELLAQALQRNANQAQQNEADDDEGMTVDLVELLFHILSKIKYVILAAVLGAVLAGCYVYLLKTPVYQATAKLYIMNQDGLSLDMADLNIGSALTMDYQEVFKTWEVHEMVREQLQLNYGYSQMQRMLTVSNPSSTRVLYITVKNADPQIATDMANAYAAAAKTFIYQTMETAEPNEFSIALVPSAATGMGKTTYMIMGCLGGMVLAVAVLVLLFLLDDRPHTPDDITKVAGIPTLAVVPREQKQGSKRTQRKERKA